VRLLDLPDDPQAAFRVRAVADRGELLKLTQTIRAGIPPARTKHCLAAIEDIAHGLAGASGVFGFPDMGTVAARLERLAERYARLAPTPLDRRRIARLIAAAETLIEQLSGVV
jgi:HPt (histidine-containing phosphotransfer) domain-containing protein